MSEAEMTLKNLRKGGGTAASADIASADDAPVLSAAAAQGEVVDAKGRKLRFRQLTLLQETDLIMAMGKHAENQLLLGRALLAAQVASINGDEVDLPQGEREYRAMLQRVERDGISAVVARNAPAAAKDGGETADAAKN
jgi:hypothetical protein